MDRPRRASAQSARELFRVLAEEDDHEGDRVRGRAFARHNVERAGLQVPPPVREMPPTSPTDMDTSALSDDFGDMALEIDDVMAMEPEEEPGTPAPGEEITPPRRGRRNAAPGRRGRRRHTPALSTNQQVATIQQLRERRRTRLQDKVHAMTLEELRALVLKMVDKRPAVVLDIIDVDMQREAAEEAATEAEVLQVALLQVAVLQVVLQVAVLQVVLQVAVLQVVLQVAVLQVVLQVAVLQVVLQVAVLQVEVAMGWSGAPVTTAERCPQIRRGSVADMDLYILDPDGKSTTSPSTCTETAAYNQSPSRHARESPLISSSLRGTTGTQKPPA
ncbi:hypothetical protein Bbelb_396650 [Branchiostoma belcheri]|nr:hypothetical protein Bbelb_396650 [Branchiostoma belcheri]